MKGYLVICILSFAVIGWSLSHRPTDNSEAKEVYVAQPAVEQAVYTAGEDGIPMYYYCEDYIVLSEFPTDNYLCYIPQDSTHIYHQMIEAGEDPTSAFIITLQATIRAYEDISMEGGK